MRECIRGGGGGGESIRYACLTHPSWLESKPMSLDLITATDPKPPPFASAAAGFIPQLGFKSPKPRQPLNPHLGEAPGPALCICFKAAVGDSSQQRPRVRVNKRPRLGHLGRAETVAAGALAAVLMCVHPAPGECAGGYQG
jgi:hypothetical protein